MTEDAEDETPSQVVESTDAEQVSNLVDAATSSSGNAERRPSRFEQLRLRLAEKRSRPVASQEELDALDSRQNIDLKAIYALGMLILLGGQVYCADWVFIQYGKGNHWHIPVAAIQAWLAATVVEVIGVVIVITRYLFPARKGRDRVP